MGRVTFWRVPRSHMRHSSHRGKQQSRFSVLSSHCSCGFGCGWRYDRFRFVCVVAVCDLHNVLQREDKAFFQQGHVELRWILTRCQHTAGIFLIVWHHHIDCSTAPPLWISVKKSVSMMQYM